MSLHEQWVPTKAGKISREGIVVAQHPLAAAAGARLLAEGGNAVDAAVATAFALGAVEPWMSGIGGAGYLLHAEAKTGKVSVVDFSLIAPKALDPARYPVIGGVAPSLFGWPAVEGDRNLKGPESICVPGSVDGLGLALETFGRKSLAEVIAPGLELAEGGLPLDWHTTLSIAICARDLAEFETSRAVYLPDGLPPVWSGDGKRPSLTLGNLAATYRRIAEAGRRDFYEGALARDIVADLGAAGNAITAADLAGFNARIVDPLQLDYRGVRFHTAPELTGGPTFIAALQAIDRRLPGGPLSRPDADTFVIYAEAIRAAFAERLASMGQATPTGSNTTHISVVDRDGNMVALTNTLLARFGSKYVLPKTGILMNNGMLWFDPTPGRPNSIGPGKRPLANMCPVVATRDGAPWAALGACGGRRIIPAVIQLASLMVDFGMPLEKAFATPRLDASGDRVLVDDRFPPEVVEALAARMPVEIVEESVYPGQFAVPSVVMRMGETGLNSGMAHIQSPQAAAVVANPPATTR